MRSLESSSVSRSGRSVAAIDHAVEDQCFSVAGWPLFEEEIREVAGIIECRPATLKRTPASPVSIWRRFSGPLPRVSRALDVRLVVGLTRSSRRGFVERIEPAAWVARDGRDPFVYGCKHTLDTSNSARKGGVRTACFIGEDASNTDQIDERFVAQCIEDFCRDGTADRLSTIHGYDCLRIADNGPRSARLPGHECSKGFDCGLCRDDFAPDGNRQLQTTWRKLIHRAEQFLSQWELVRIDTVESPRAWDGLEGVRFGSLDGWPLWDP